MLTASCRVMLPASFSRFRNSWMLHGHHKALVQRLGSQNFDNDHRAEVVQQRGMWRLQRALFPLKSTEPLRCTKLTKQSFQMLIPRHRVALNSPIHSMIIHVKRRKGHQAGSQFRGPHFSSMSSFLSWFLLTLMCHARLSGYHGKGRGASNFSPSTCTYTSRSSSEALGKVDVSEEAKAP